MAASSNLDAFLKFLQSNAQELFCELDSQKRLDWLGRESNEPSSCSERVNFFSREFAHYFATKLMQHKWRSVDAVPLIQTRLCHIRKTVLPQDAPFGRFQLIARTFAHLRSTYNVKFLTDKGVFVTGGDDGYLCVWSLLNGELLQRMLVHQHPINHLEYFQERHILLTTDIRGEIALLDCEHDIKVAHTLKTDKDIDKVHLFVTEDALKLFVAFKDGPYVIYRIDELAREIFRSGSSYKESAILTSDGTAFYLVKTSAGLFSISFCRESQEIWFLAQEDPYYLLANRKGNLLIALCSDGRALCMAKHQNEPRPFIANERQVNYDFSNMNLVQVFDRVLVAVKFVDGASDVTIYSITEEGFFDLRFQRRLHRVCYSFCENPVQQDLLVIATGDGSLLWLNLYSGEITAEKQITVSINDMRFSDDGRTLILLDESGSVSMYSSGYMPCDAASLKIYSEEHDPNKYGAHLRLWQQLRQQAASSAKRKRDVQSQDKRRTKESKTAPVPDESTHLPYWNSVHVNQALPYVPQLRDEVLYFTRPHIEFLRRNSRKLKERIDYEDKLDLNKPYIGGVIEHIEYVPSEVTKCKIGLKVMLGRKAVRLDFGYFFGTSQPNFLVLKSAYELSSQHKFKVNETVRILSPPFQGETGIILEIRDDADPTTSFGCYKILCKRREATIPCSHWEIGKLRGTSEMRLEELAPHEAATLKDIVAALLSDERWSVFYYPVDFSEFPEYYAAVPYPMYLELIHKRLSHGYYRHVQSFLWDMQQIAVDALIFNEPYSDIVREGNEMVEFVVGECKRHKLSR